MALSLIKKINQFTHQTRYLSAKTGVNSNFETVFSFPFIKYIALFNRLKVYHLAGSGVGVPTAGLLEMFNILSEHTFLSASYIAITGAAVLSVASLPFTNIIGFLYISEDNKLIKISSVNFWGNRVDKTVSANDWVPLYDLKSRQLDALFLSPQLTDNTKYKLFIKFGQVLNSNKMAEVLE